jgi:hypothetical protein
MTASLHVSLLRQNTKHAYSCRAATLSTKIAGAGNELKYSYFGPYWISHSLAYTLKQCFHPCIYFPENELWIHTLLKLGSTLWMLWRDAHCTCICVRKCDHISYHHIHTYVRMCMHARRHAHTQANTHLNTTHTHWYPSHLQMKDQGRKLSCKNDRVQQFLCLLVLLLDTYSLEKTLLHFMKKIAVRPSKVQHPEIHTACADLHC